MAKDDVIEVEGKVLEIIPGGKFKVKTRKRNNCRSSRFW